MDGRGQTHQEGAGFGGPKGQRWALIVHSGAGTLLARLHADLLPCAAGVRQRLSASEKYIIGFKDSST